MTDSTQPRVAEIVCDYILDNQTVVDAVDASIALDKLNIGSLKKKFIDHGSWGAFRC